MKSERNVKLLTLDTETFGLEGELKRIAVYDGINVTYGYTYDDIEPVFYKWYNDGFAVHIYIHNMDFDLRKIPQIFDNHNIVWSHTKLIGSRYARLKCKDYTFHDSFKILPMSLSKASKDFDLKHGKLDLWDEVKKEYPKQYNDIDDYFRNCDKDDPLYVKYLGYDVISLYELIEKLIDVSGILITDFVKCMSTASLSKYLYKNGYKGILFGDKLKTDYEIMTSCPSWGSTKKIKESSISYLECEYKIREAFYGGRTEMFASELKEILAGQVNGYKYDINSMYPSVMLFEYPVGYPEYIDDKVLAYNCYKKWMKHHRGLGFIKASVYIPPQEIPPLPVKVGKLAFVTGFVTGAWTYSELEFAIKNCGVIIHGVHHVIHFKNTYKVFENFVKTMYKLKVQGKETNNDALTAFAKLILNTAYGWTVLRRDDKTALRDIRDLPKWQDSEKLLHVNNDLGCLTILDDVHSESIQVQVGTYITSYARLELLKALLEVSKTGRAYYCDTDSIITDVKFPNYLVSATELGKWDCEAELISAIFVAPKVYTEHKIKNDKVIDTVKFKGVTKHTQQTYNREIYEYILGQQKRGKKEKIYLETRSNLSSLSVAQKTGKDPNQLNTIEKYMHMDNVPKRNFDFINNTSIAWHINSFEEFENFTLLKPLNPWNGGNLL